MSAAVGLAEALERAASALPEDADAIRPANGDPVQLARVLDADAARRVLVWLLDNEPQAAEELAAEWSEDEEGAGRTVLGLDPAELPKRARKTLRRVLHRLRSRGIDVPDAPRPAVVATLPPVDDALHEGRVSALDPRGFRVVYLAVDHPGGGVRLFEAVIDELRGVLDFDVYNTGRSRIRKLFKEFEQAGARRAAQAPPDAVRALLARAVAAQPAARPLPRGFAEWRSRLIEPGSDPRTPGEIARASLSGGLDPDAALVRAKQWVEGGSLGPWPPLPERAREAAGRIADAGKGVLVVSEGTRREQVERALDQAVADLFDADFCEVTARRLEESAYVMWKTGGEEDARAALGAADAFRQRPAAENPVARAMLERVFAPLLAEARAEPGSDAGGASGGGEGAA
jgi:hypothetical protein